jgi:hypothetical protein
VRDHGNGGGTRSSALYLSLHVFRIFSFFASLGNQKEREKKRTVRTAQIVSRFSLKFNFQQKEIIAHVAEEVITYIGGA